MYIAALTHIRLSSVLTVYPRLHEVHFVGTAKEGDTVHLPCPLHTLHGGPSSLYLIRWSQENHDIVYGNKYSKLPNHILVIRDFNESDTENSFYCKMRRIGSDDLGENYLVSGPRQLRVLGEL